jgi:nucleoside-diphosphate-sugar epimerase
VQRIVITSSCAAVISLPLSKPTVFSEQDWNLNDIKRVQEMGDKSPPSTAYRASKTLAEKGSFLNILFFGLPLTCFLQSAAWHFYELHKPQIKWDLAVINPPFVSCCFFYKNKDIIANC